MTNRACRIATDASPLNTLIVTFRTGILLQHTSSLNQIRIVGDESRVAFVHASAVIEMSVVSVDVDKKFSAVTRNTNLRLCATLAMHRAALAFVSFRIKTFIAMIHASKYD